MFRRLALVAFAAGLAFGAEKAPNPVQLAAQLESTDVAARRNATHELGKLGAKAVPALPALIKALDDADRQVWMNAVGAIAAIGPEARDAIPALIAEFDSKNASRQRGYYRDQVIVRMGYALTRIGPAAIPPLIEGLRSQDTMLRSGAARALGGMGAAANEAIPALIENLGHGDPGVKQEVVDALGAIGAAAKPKLVEALAWNEPGQRSTAALALGAMGRTAQDAAAPMLARLKAESDATVRVSLLTALPRVGADARLLVPALIDGMKDEHEPIRHAATNGLLTLSSARAQIVKELGALVRDANPAWSERAVYVLGRLGTSAGSAVPAILEVIAKQSPPSQKYLDALVQIGEPAVAPMLAAFEKAKPANLGRDHWVVQCLQQMGGLGAAPIARNLAHPSAAVRFLAVRSLAALGADAGAVVPGLLKALEDDDLHVRSAALAALVAVRTPLAQIEPHLVGAFASASPLMRAAAVESVVRLGEDGRAFHGKVIAALKDRDESVRSAVLEQLGPAYADAVPQLLPLLDEPARRGAAIEALGRIGVESKPAVPQFVKLLQSGAKPDRVRILAALERIGPAASEALPALEPARADPDPAVRIAAYQAMATVETRKTERVQALAAGLDDADRAVRQAVAGSLGRLGDQAADAFPKLVALAEKDSDRDYALPALGLLNVRDVPKLVGLLGNPTRDLQLFALRRLESLGRRARDAVPAIEPIARTSDYELSRAARRAMQSITNR
ncbi:MAG: HEAT repeat domain-containing protein [Chthoniobacteraceae bacterium]